MHLENYQNSAQTILHHIVRAINHQAPPEIVSDRCYDKAGTETCQYRVKAGFDCKQKFMEIDCALTCGYCGKES